MNKIVSKICFYIFLLIKYSTIVKYSRKNGNQMKHCGIHLQTSIKLLIHLEVLCNILIEFGTPCNW